MASPQLENGYTKIANEILEHLSHPGINGSEFRLVCFIIRKTYGYNKKQDKISLSQFQRGVIMNRSHVCRTIKSLVHKRVLLKEKSLYKFNKNWNDWVVHKRVHSTQKGNGVVHKRVHTKDNNTKYNISGSLNAHRIPLKEMYNENEEQSDGKEIDVDTGEEIKKTSVKPKPKNKLAWELLSHFQDMSVKATRVKPKMGKADYVLMCQTLKVLSEDQVRLLVKSWFSSGKPDDKLIHATQMLSNFNINNFKLEYGIKT